MKKSGAYGIYRLKGKEITTFHYFRFKEYSREECENEGYELIATARTFKEACAIIPLPRKNN